MNSREANQIIEWLKEGKTYKTGHYHYSYFYYSYDDSRQLIKVFERDHSMNVFEPSERTDYLSVEKHKEHLMEYDNFEDIKSRMGID